MCKCFGRVGENREGMETGDAGREGGDAAICVALVKGETQIAVDIGKRTFISIHAPAKGATAKITKTIPNDLRKINNYNNSFTQICAKHNCKFDIR